VFSEPALNNRNIDKCFRDLDLDIRLLKRIFVIEKTIPIVIGTKL